MLDCLCKGLTVLSDNQQSLFILTKPYCALKFMSERSSQSSLSLTSGSNGSSSDMQDNVSPSHNSAQSSNPTLLDRIRSHHSGQPTEPIRLTFSDAFKFELGSSGGGSQPTIELKLSHQSRSNEPTRVILIGKPSNPTP